MPESRVRKTASQKRKTADRSALARKRYEESRLAGGDRGWVPWVFSSVGLLGVAWLVVYYVAGYQVPGMSSLGDWNVLIGMGLMAAAFALATLWK
ncbi:cell division protein CrgA [Aestuariimicrobium ganziense]|uniref:cell division protein CrgA n=1 Tax=Aestuariimicrobium ganziense TaxID=2773677 RepID=UPI0019431147|nr:cell division protein CrgA [Aestuariimicrobium ganziense]